MSDLSFPQTSLQRTSFLDLDPTCPPTQETKTSPSPVASVAGPFLVAQAPPPELAQLGVGSDHLCDTHELVKAVVRRNPYSAAYGKVGETWTSVLLDLQSQGISRYTSVEAVKYKAQQLLTWYDTSEHMGLQRPKLPSEIKFMSKEQRSSLERDLETMLGLKDTADGDAHVKEFDARHPGLFKSIIARSTKRKHKHISSETDLPEVDSESAVVRPTKKYRRQGGACSDCQEFKTLLAVNEEARKRDYCHLLGIVEANRDFNRQLMDLVLELLQNTSNLETR